VEMNLKRKSRSSEARKKLAGMRLALAEAERSIRSVVENSLRDKVFFGSGSLQNRLLMIIIYY